MLTVYISCCMVFIVFYINFKYDISLWGQLPAIIVAVFIFSFWELNKDIHHLQKLDLVSTFLSTLIVTLLMVRLVLRTKKLKGKIKD